MMCHIFCAVLSTFVSMALQFMQIKEKCVCVRDIHLIDFEKRRREFLATKFYEFAF